MSVTLFFSANGTPRSQSNCFSSPLEREREREREREQRITRELIRLSNARHPPVGRADPYIYLISPPS